MAEVREVCDYIMIISRGKLVASDTLENLESGAATLEDIFLELTETQAEKDVPTEEEEAVCIDEEEEEEYMEEEEIEDESDI